MDTVSNAAAQWVRRFHDAPRARARLVCFPHAGGSANFFLPLSAALAPRFEVLAIQYPGRQDRMAEPSLHSVPELAVRAAAALARLDRMPVAFLGHSLGAAVAYETAVLARERGAQPAVLFASARRSPSSARVETRHLLSDAGLVAELDRLGGTDPRVLAEPELMALLLPAVRADFTAAETYFRAPGAALSCPIHVLTGDADTQVTPAEAREWARHTSGEVGVSEFHGGHFFLSERISEVRTAIGTVLRSLEPSAKH